MSGVRNPPGRGLCAGFERGREDEGTACTEILSLMVTLCCDIVIENLPLSLFCKQVQHTESLSDKQADSYRKTVKSTAVVGGAQAVQMVVVVLRAKLVAVLLGSAGMGAIALIQSALSAIQQFSSFGIFQSGVRELSHRIAGGDAASSSLLWRVFMRLALVCGVLGTAVCLFASPLLSRFTFGDTAHAGAFAWVSVSLLLLALSNAYMTWMQANRRLKYLAAASLGGATLSLAVAVPIFYFMGLRGIVPAIVAGYAAMWLFNAFFARRIKPSPVPAPTLAVTIEQGKPIVKLGAALMLSTVLMTTLAFVLNGFISHVGGVDDVGFYQSAFNICMHGMVVVNATLASDYFPRLSAVCHSRVRVRRMVAQQAELITLVIGPMAVLLSALAPWVVRLLLAEEFRVVVPMLRWMSLALVFRGLWNVLGFVALAKGDRKTFLYYDAVLGHGLNFVLNVAAYYFWGLDGLAVSYVAGAVAMCLILGTVVRRKYGVRLTGEYFRLLGMFVLVITASIASALFLEGIYHYLSAAVLALAAVGFSVRQLERRTGMFAALGSRFRKNKTSIK